MPNMQVLYPYYVKKKIHTHMKAMLQWQMWGCILKFELNESIIKQLIKHLFHNFLTVILLQIKMWLSNKF